MKEKTKINTFPNLPGPIYDNKIYYKFSKTSISKKIENKKKFCEENNLSCGKNDILLSIVSELSDDNNAEIFIKILEGLISIDIKICIIGFGSKKYHDILESFIEKNKNNIVILQNSNDNLRKTLAASDATFFFSLSEKDVFLIRKSLAYASLPIVPDDAQEIIEDYNPNQEKGNGFIYKTKNYWSAFSAIIRAKESFRFPYDYMNLQKNCMSF